MCKSYGKVRISFLMAWRSYPRWGAILKTMFVRNGNVWIEKENNEWFVIIILKYLKNCYINNNDINYNIYPLLTPLCVRHVVQFSCNSHNNPKCYVLYCYYSNFTDKELDYKGGSRWGQDFIHFHLLLRSFLSATAHGPLCKWGLSHTQRLRTDLLLMERSFRVVYVGSVCLHLK